MNTIEDRIRAATRAAADLVPDDSARPLDFSQVRTRTGWSRRLHRRNRPGRRGVWAVVTPLAAAVAVAVVAVVPARLAGGSHTERAGTPGGALSLVPRYFMVLPWVSPQAEVRYAEIRDTVTGEVLAVVRPPRPYHSFSLVSGASDDLTFVLMAQASQEAPSNASGPGRLYLARFNPGSRTVRLTPLPIPAFHDVSRFSGLALSPDGSRLAVAFSGNGLTWHGTLRIYSTSTGQLGREWEETGSIGAVLDDPFAMSWVGDGTLAFNWFFDQRSVPPLPKGITAADSGVWLLNTRAPAAGLLADSRFVMRVSQPGGWGFDTGDGILTQNGKTVVAGVDRGINNPKLAIRAEIREFSVATGQLVRVLWPTHGLYESSLWSNSSGSAVVVAVPVSRRRATVRQYVGVLAGNRFVRIPRFPVMPFGWPIIAF